ncbi:MAG: hypothetical protein OXI67_13910 [Candidatus Poribacteria bacterium]|nr:hypothetical protein [Candidatus Poribacteria bacterium]
MINRKHRVIAAFLLCVMLFSVLAVPIGHSKDKPPTSKSAVLWAALTVLLDILDVYDILIGVIIKDLKAMEDRLAEINDELNDKWYPKKDKKEKELETEQGKLDDLNAEREAALEKRRGAQARIKTLESDISKTETLLKLYSDWTPEHAAYQAQLEMQKSSLASAEQEVKEANKIIRSDWRAIKRTYYEWIIGDAFSGLTGELCDIKGRINTLERQADILRREISKKTTEEENETTRRAGVQRDVDKKREEHAKQVKKEKQEAQNER